MKTLGIVLLGTILCSAFAYSDALAVWTDIGLFNAGGGAKEVGVNRQITKLKITCQNRPVIINTVVMREGGKKTPFTLGKKFVVNEEFVLDLGGKHHVTGFRVSDDLKGSYRLQVE
jgi:hypothetical protein